MAKDRAVVLCSGGLNAAVTAAVAKRDHDLAMMHVTFAHRAEKAEAEMFERQVEYFGPLSRMAVAMPHFAAIGGNARVDRDMELEDALAIGDGGSNAYVPGMIGAMLSAAFTWALRIGATRIYLGVSENLGPPAPPTMRMYPDYSRECVESWRHAFEAASPKRPVAIETPLRDLNRREVIQLGHRLGAPLDRTWSCLASSDAPCGACIGCATRTHGFLHAAIPDPLLCDAAAQ